MKNAGNIVQNAIEAKRVVALILFGIMAVGVLGIIKMNKDEFPTVEIKDGLVAAIYPGASASQVETDVTKPLEEVLMSCPEVDRSKIRSISQDGICYIYVSLDVPSSKLKQAWTDIKFKFQTKKLTLPLNVLAVVVLDDFSSISSLLISLKSDDKGWSEMSDYAKELKERLLTIEDVAKVSILGEQTEEIAVTADLDRLSSYGVSPALLNLSYATESFHIPSGTYKDGTTSSRIYIEDQLLDEDDISNQIIFNDPTGGIIRLSDVATVERRVKEKTSSIKYNGANTLLMSVSMRNDKDIVAFGAEIDKVLKDFQNELPDSVQMSRVTDQPKVVKTSVLNFLRDLIISILVVIAVMLVLFPFNCAIVASTGVPACTAVAIAVMYVVGMPLNTVTLAGLIVVLGMIVDDSIVTMDGYMDMRSRGLGRVEAAVASAKELFVPMLMATLSISLMLFPMLFILPGHLKEVFGMFPWVLAVALMTSLAYALFVIPSLEVKFIGGADPDKEPSGFAKLQEKFFATLQSIYEKGEHICFKAPKLTILSGVLLVLCSFWIFSKLSVQLLPKASRNLFVVEVLLDEGSEVARTQKVADSLTNMILTDPRVVDVTTFVGQSAPRFHATYAPSLPAKNFAQLIINTKNDDATLELIKEFENKYEYYFPNAVLRIKQMDYQGVTAPVEYTLRSKDRSVLYAYADSLSSYMRAQNDLMQWVHTDYAQVPSVNIKLDKDETSRLNINPATLALSLGQEFGSSSLMSYTEGDNRKYVPVVLYGKNASDSVTYDAISNKVAHTPVPGVNVPLRQIADITPQWSANQLVRHGGVDESVTVSADVKLGKSHPVAVRRINKWMKKNFELPEGVTLEEGGLTKLNEEYLPPLMWSLLAAVLVMFVFLLIHFKKINISVMTMSMSLLCLFGAFLGLYIFELDFSMTAFLGLISLIGIIVRNGIIMFEYAEELHFEEGYSYKDAAMLAGSRRMRPIFLTSCTAALGVLPMIISGDALWMPMGVMMCFGVMLTLPFTVLIMPVSYWQLFAKKDKEEAAK